MRHFVAMRECPCSTYGQSHLREHIVALELVCWSFAKAVRQGKMPNGDKVPIIRAFCIKGHRKPDICSSCKSFTTLRGLFNHVDANKRDVSVGNSDDPHYDESGYTDESDTEEEMSHALCTHQLFYTALRSTQVTDKDIRQWEHSGVVAKARRQRGEHANMLVGP